MTVRQHGNEIVLVPSLSPEFVRNVIRIHQTAAQIVFSHTDSTFSQARAHRFNKNGTA